jgi:surfeit locus 1 family protein
MLLGPRVHEGKRGFQLITPLVRTDGSTILVNRGFILREFADPSTRAEDNDEVDVIGILRTSHARNNFTPENHPEDGEWYWLDVDAMSAFAGGKEAGVQPVLVEEVFGEPHKSNALLVVTTHSVEGHAGIAGSRLSKGIPLGRSAAVDLRNAHLSYVITW